MPLAAAKGLDVGLVRQQDVVVRASEIDLTMLMRNLVDNAIRYTPEGGRVDLSVESGRTVQRFRCRTLVQASRRKIARQVFDPFPSPAGRRGIRLGPRSFHRQDDRRPRRRPAFPTGQSAGADFKSS